MRVRHNRKNPFLVFERQIREEKNELKNLYQKVELLEYENDQLRKLSKKTFFAGENYALHYDAITDYAAWCEQHPILKEKQ